MVSIFYTCSRRTYYIGLDTYIIFLHQSTHRGNHHDTFRLLDAIFLCIHITYDLSIDGTRMVLGRTRSTFHLDCIGSGMYKEILWTCNRVHAIFQLNEYRLNGIYKYIFKLFALNGCDCFIVYILLSQKKERVTKNDILKILCMIVK